MNARLDRYPNLLKGSPFDVVLVALVVIACAAFVWPAHPRVDQTAASPRTALIYQDGCLLYQIDLRENRTVVLPEGGIKVVVRDGGVRIVEADCPKHVCVNTGAIRLPGQVIACVPNKTLIEIKSTSPQFLDAVAN
jgi:hypothetical protein